MLRADTHVPSLTALDLELICAGLPGIDVDDWRTHTVWHAQGVKLGEFEYVPLRDAFFGVLGRMDVEQRAKVLSFTCGSGRLPAAGFRALKPPFNVEVLPACAHAFLPQAHTCFNTICLPPYEGEEEMEARLLSAIDAGAGFGVR